MESSLWKTGTNHLAYAPQSIRRCENCDRPSNSEFSGIIVNEEDAAFCSRNCYWVCRNFTKPFNGVNRLTPNTQSNSVSVHFQLFLCSLRRSIRPSPVPAGRSARLAPKRIRESAREHLLRTRVIRIVTRKLQAPQTREIQKRTHRMPLSQISHFAFPG